MNPNITWDIIQSNPEMPWDMAALLSNENITSLLPSDGSILTPPTDIIVLVNDVPTQKFFIQENTSTRVKFQFNITDLLPEGTLEGYFINVAIKRFIGQDIPSVLLMSEYQPDQFNIISATRGIFQVTFLAADTTDLQLGNYYTEFSFKNAVSEYIIPFPLQLYAVIAKGLF